MCYAGGMGDRTTTETTIAASDLDAAKDALLPPRWRAEDLGFVDEFDNGDGTVTFLRHDVNYGGDGDADALQIAGIPFVIRHEAGGSYPAGHVVFDGSARAWFYGSDGRLMISFDEATGEPDPADHARAREFLALRESARRAIRQRADAARIPESERER